MRQATCDSCRASGGLGTFFRVSGSQSLVDKLYCANCAEKAQSPGEDLRIASAIDPTVCTGCNSDWGSSELPLVGGLPFCPSCRAGLYNRPLPNWLKLALALTMLLLAVALVHGRKYFAVEKELVLGERLVGQRHYAEAAGHLRVVVTAAPECDRCALLLGKALFLSAQPAEAEKVLTGHKGGRYEKGPLFEEVSGIARRVGAAVTKAEQADKAAKENRWEESARLWREAAKLYPEAPGLRDTADYVEGVAAFNAKDYDKFLAINEGLLQRYPKSGAWMLAVASALACKYAVTGEQEFRRKAEEFMLQGRAALDAGPSNPEDRKNLEALEQRTRYRIETRQILSPEEYEARFGAAKAAEKE